LVDTHHRLTRAGLHDEMILPTFVEKELRRHNESLASLERREKRINALKTVHEIKKPVDDDAKYCEANADMKIHDQELSHEEIGLKVTFDVLRNEVKYYEDKYHEADDKVEEARKVSGRSNDRKQC
jgi:hypothetical protein